MPGPSVLTSAESSELGLVRKLPKLVEKSGSGDPEKSKEKIINCLSDCSMYQLADPCICKNDLYNIVWVPNKGNKT